MKRFFVILLVTFVAFSLGCHRSQNTQNTSVPTDFHGTYLGILPCADCEGIETEIILHKDNTYVKKTKYLGKDDNQETETGTYKWSNLENEIILQGITNAPNKYFVDEGAIVQADMDGERITGELSMNYILRKSL
ncbi:MAG: copper resistance protein NlpE [Bacteroidales bacterium]|jgi:uncharacterized lipoprotein NlpE involved in copper resistance|nr:copper resistance protein NlpE [Bacteroidales bacterium]